MYGCDTDNMLMLCHDLWPLFHGSLSCDNMFLEISCVSKVKF